MKELDQLSSQVLRASETGLNVLLIGDTNLDHMNPNHRKATEANEFLQYIEGSSMRHLKTGPTWQSHGLFKNCSCLSSGCNCPRVPRTSTIDNAFCSISMNANIKILPDTISDHSPLLVDIKLKSGHKESKLETKWTRDLNKVRSSDFEAALVCYGWSQMYAMSDPDEAATFLTKNVLSALDKVAPRKMIKFRPDKPPLYLKRDTLKVMALRDSARISKNRNKFKALRNQANKMIKRDKIQSILTRLKKYPGPKQTWKEAKTLLGKGRGAKNLPTVTSNSDPNETADTQNRFFVDKIAKLVSNISSEHEDKMPFKCTVCDVNLSEKNNLTNYTAKVHVGKKPFKCKLCDDNFLTTVPCNFTLK